LLCFELAGFCFFNVVLQSFFVHFDEDAEVSDVAGVEGVFLFELLQFAWLLSFSHALSETSMVSPTRSFCLMASSSSAFVMGLLFTFMTFTVVSGLSSIHFAFLSSTNF
jgi:hypothetical protein